MIFELVWLLSSLTIAAMICCLSRYLGKEILPAALAGALVTAVFVAGKLGDINIFGPTAISASIIIYSMTFLLTDVMSELHGRDFTQRAVWGTILCYPIVILSTQMSVSWEPSQFYATQEAYASVMSTAFRVTLASVCGFTASQTFDVWAFHKIRRRTGRKNLWLRNNLSTMGSQLIDTCVFYTIAFSGILPAPALLRLIAITYLLKLMIAAFDTPFVYLVVGFIRKGETSAQDKSIEA